MRRNLIVGDQMGNPSWYCVLFARHISVTTKGATFPVHYLIQNLGFSLRSATLASKRLIFETPQKPNSVLAFFKSHGFSQAQISKIIRQRPQILTYDPDKTLLPKLEFLHSKGLSSSEVALILERNPVALASSLEKTLIPSFNYLTSLFGSESATFLAVKRISDVLGIDHESSSAKNVSFLKENGVPNSKVVALFPLLRRVLNKNADRFRESVEEVRKMGFDPETTKFLVGVATYGVISKKVWDRKVNVYCKWGWSEKDVLSAFRNHPYCMRISVDKIRAVMEFVVNEMDLEPLDIVKYPRLLSFSLEKRIFPRALVARTLVSKGLLKKEFSLPRLWDASERRFLDSYVHPYEEEVPGLLKLYKDQLAGQKILGL